MLLLLDNYDSFTYNLEALLLGLGVPVRTLRADSVRLAEVQALAPQAVVISPGPGTPEAAPCRQLVSQLQVLHPQLPLLGICLGHQLLGMLAGAAVVRARRPMHGHTSRLLHHSAGLFAGLPQGMEVMRYHSLVVEPDTLPADWQTTAWTATGEVMGLRHCLSPWDGLQFHPESVLTQHGAELVGNWYRQRVLPTIENMACAAQTFALDLRQ